MLTVTMTPAPRPAAGEMLMAPLGVPSAHGSLCCASVAGGRILEVACEIETGQPAAVIAPDGEALPVITYRWTAAKAAPPYPESAFQPRLNRYTRAADALVVASRGMAARAGGGFAAIEALACETASRFTYDHPEVRFNDGHDAVPYLACGTTPGSCVDIHTYLVASLRAAGFEAAYCYGFYFHPDTPDRAPGMHCWVAVRHHGDVIEYDISHCLIAGLPVRAGLNPMGGSRVLLGHSMGHAYETHLGHIETKLLANPIWLRGTDELTRADPVGVQVIARDA